MKRVGKKGEIDGIWADLDRSEALTRHDPSSGWRTAAELGKAWGCTRCSAKRRADVMVGRGELECRTVKLGPKGIPGTVYRPKRR